MGDASAITAEQMEQVLRVSRALALTIELDELLPQIADACCTILDCERASIFLHDARTGELWTRIALQSEPIRVPVDAGIVGYSFTNNLLVHVPDPYSDPRFNPEPDRRSGFVTRNLLTAPMLDLKHQPVGVIQAVNKRDPRGFLGSADAPLLQLLADQAGVAIQRSELQRAAVAAAALRKEMELARDVQMALIPARPPQIPGLKSAGYSVPASITGGDAFDLWTTPNRKLGLFVGDATGHGIAPALVVSQARTLVRAMSAHRDDPLELFHLINPRLVEDMEPGRFVTAFYANLDSSGVLQWTSAGHGPVFIRRSGTASIEALEPPAPPLGVIDPLPADATESIQLGPQGMVCVVSDGIIEAFDPAGEQFGVDRVIQILDEQREKDPQSILDALQQAVRAWQQSDDPRDDQTAIIAVRS
jgi:phosphoserine phosphatase